MRSSSYPLVAGALLLVGAAGPPARAGEDRWADFRFLIGSWVSDGKPERGSGSFTLQPDLDGKVLVRHNSASLPAGPGRAPVRHEDLMVVYPDRGGKQFRASYFDNEGHVIHYTVSPLPAQKGLVFLSEPDASAPRFRLTYSQLAEDRVSVVFELAPPGQPEKFRLYLSGTAKRTAPNK